MIEEPIDDLIQIKPIKTDLSGQTYGPWEVERYLYHKGIVPIWRARCIYCDKGWDAPIPKFKKTKECECEDSLKFTSGAYIVNNIYMWYFEKAAREEVGFKLKYNDLYKIYRRQNGVDLLNNKLIFDYHWNYNPVPPTCNYIWPDLLRKNNTSSYNLENCYFKANYDQRFPRKHNSEIKKLKNVF